MTRIPGFIGPTYSLQSVSADCQRCVNLFPQLSEIGPSENGEIGVLMRTPGLTLLGTIGTGPIRGLYVASNGNLYCVSGNGLYQVSSSWVGTRLGTLYSTSGRVEFIDNGVQMVLTDGQGYLLTFATNVLLPLVGVTGWMGSNCAAYLDEWGIFAVPGSNAFYTSNQLDLGTYNGLNVSYKQGFGDPIVSVIVDKATIWLLGRETSEPWYNAGNPSPGIVFSRVPNALIDIGCCSPHSPQKVLNNGIIFLGDGKHGAGIVWQIQGYAPSRISTHAVEQALQSYGYANLQNATAWTYQQDGHGFYALNVPGAPVTWVYDVTSKAWHERAHLVLGLDFRHQADCHAWFNGQHVVGDYQTGLLYALDKANYTDNGSPLRWLRRSPHITANLNRMVFNSFQLDLETGMATDTGQGSNPVVMLRYSDDAGHTWSGGVSRPAGNIGGYLGRAKWQQLGQSRNRVFEVSGSDPVATVILGADLIVTPCAS